MPSDPGAFPPTISKHITFGGTLIQRPPETTHVPHETRLPVNATPVVLSNGNAVMPIDANPIHDVSGVYGNMTHAHLPAPLPPGVLVPNFPQAPATPSIPPLPAISLPPFPEMGTPAEIQAWRTSMQTAAQTQRSAIRTWFQNVRQSIGNRLGIGNGPVYY